MRFMERSAKHFAAEVAARQIAQEVSEAGIENLKILAESGRSIVGTFLAGCSEERKKSLRQDFNTLLKMGVTVDMILDKVAGHIPEIKPIMMTMASYRKAEIEKLIAFLKEQ